MKTDAELDRLLWNSVAIGVTAERVLEAIEKEVPEDDGPVVVGAGIGHDDRWTDPFVHRPDSSLTPNLIEDAVIDPSPEARPNDRHCR